MSSFACLEFNFAPSYYYCYSLVLAYSASALSLYLVEFSLLYTLSALLLLVVLAVYQYKCLLKPEIKGLRVEADKQQMQLLYKQKWLKIERVHKAYLLPYLIAFEFSVQGETGLKKLFVWADSLDANSYRRLRVIALQGCYIKS